jgi:predicted AlkP superfamily phosphohydrolase/phosphomutase
MSTRPELLIFGVDGMSFELTRALIQAGRLPHLGALAREAALVPLRCTWPPHTATGWASFVAGTLPGHHGIFQFWDCQDPDYEHRVAPRTALGRPTLLDALAEAGRGIGMVNLPMSHPPSEWRGYEITWPLTPTLRFFRPPELFRTLCGVGGHVRSDVMCMYDGSPDYPARARAQIQARTRAMRHLMTARPTEVVGVVYTEVDRVSHPYWHELEAGASGARAVIPEIYAEVDRALGELLELAGDDATVLVVSDHGFGPCTRGLGVHRMLSEGGFCTLRAGLAPQDEGAGDHQGVSRLASSLDWASTRFYMPTPGCFGLNVNLQGRQRHGSVPEGQRDEAIVEVTAYLLGLRDPADGGPLFSAVVPREIAYPGPFVASAPDLLLVPRDPTLLLLADPHAPFWGSAGQSGIHTLDGVCLLRSRGRSPSAQAPPAGIEALAGRLLEELGIEAPWLPRHSAAEVQAAAAFLPEGAWQARAGHEPLAPGSLSPRTAPGGPPSGATLPADASIEERLRLLGYW